MDRDALTPEQAASCMMHVFQCAGREARGNILRCHPDAEPGGWHVGLGMLLLEGTHATREEAVDEARAVARWVAVGIRYDREGLFLKHTSGPQPEFEPEPIVRGKQSAPTPE